MGTDSCFGSDKSGQHLKYFPSRIDKGFKFSKKTIFINFKFIMIKIILPIL